MTMYDTIRCDAVPHGGFARTYQFHEGLEGTSV
eukprot:CAMPEP_0168290466 /NCGR_PEP_ID=MMETSP0142_2-20121227/5359_1 /TAXON_ID=44445 /ORGANISM="Pseudo-nitzschia australis, Strain 10249 10 AB" /LENGTH=32 /DNA_ID= /DNA_START= /DNA_END= /DNA_ORIENTATION=